MPASADRPTAPKIGVVFPQTDIGPDVSAARDFLQAAQDLGYAFLSIYDHVLGADTRVYTDWRPGAYHLGSQFHEPMVFYGWVAAVAPKLELETGVMVLPQRQTALMAKQAAEVDRLTNGRLRLGVGIGWNYVEYEALGMRFSDRGRRLEEQIALLRALWTQDAVTFEGRYHTVRAAGINPPPIQRPIPIWFGASAAPALKRAAELGDGLITQQPLEGGWPATMQQLRAWREAAGKSWNSFGIHARIPARGDNPDEWRQQAETWRGLGATHLSVVTLNLGLQGPDAHIACIRQAAEALGVHADNA